MALSYSERSAFDKYDLQKRLEPLNSRLMSVHEGFIFRVV